MVKKIAASWWQRGPFLLLAAVFAVAAATLVSRGKYNADEGFYVMVSKLVLEGRLPYRDFAYTQTPLFPYIQGVAMAVVGFGVREQRWLNVLWDACALAIVVWRLRRSAIPASVSCALAGLWVCTLPVLYFCVIGKTYAFVQLLLVLAAQGLWFDDRRRALGWVAFFGAVAVGCRLTVAPAAAVLYLGAAVRAAGRGRGLVEIVLTPLILGAALLLPFFWAAPENAYFWMWEYHAKSAVSRRSWGGLAGELAAMAPGILGLVLFAVGRRGALQRPFSPSAWCLAAGGLGVVVNIFVPRVYVEYSAPFWLLLLMGAGGLVAGRGLLLRWDRRHAVLVSGLMLGAVTGSAFFASQHRWSRSLDLIDDIVAAVRARTAEDSLVLSAAPEVVLQSGRRHHPKLVMGWFAVTGEMDRSAAERLRIMHFLELVSLLERGAADAVVLRRSDVGNFERSVPSLREFDAIYMERLSAAVIARYRMEYQNEGYMLLVRADAR